jgi:hypothetical protein
MPRKFVLIDPSISDMVGHYYEYAVHVLNAADRAGYRTYLATNRGFAGAAETADSEAPKWAIYRAYKYGFWSPTRSGGRFSRPIDWLRQLGFRGLCAFRFSIFGMVWTLRNNFTEFVLNQPASWTTLKSLAIMAPLMALLKFVRFLILLTLAPFAAARFLLWRLFRLFKPDPLKHYLKTLFSDCIGLWRLMALAISRRNEAVVWVRQFRCLRRFASDTERLFARIQLADGDKVFLPTVSAIELMGLAAYLGRSPVAEGVSWHLLFRRDIHRGPVAQDPVEEQSVEGLRRVFLNSMARLAGRAVYFYTDTEELTAQYNRLRVVSFRTLPIPHTHRPVERDSSQRPLRAVYSGDARREKGYHHLPHVIQDLWSDYVEAGKVEFALQSNYNVAEGEPEAVIARCELEHFPSGPVRLFKEPLSSVEYQSMLLSGDIHLLLYDAANYYARSSGILVEALSVGVPVLVPAGTWLARQFLGDYYDHQERLRNQLDRVASKDGSQIRWHLHGNPSINPCSAGEVVATAQGKAYCWLRVPAGADRLIVSFRIPKDPPAVVLYVDQLDQRRRSVVPLLPRLIEVERKSRKAVSLLTLAPGAVRLWLAFGAPYANGQVLVSDITIDFLSAAQDTKRLPTGTVGLIYHDPVEIPVLLRELIDEYPHYRRTARAFAEPWALYHNASRLVEELEGAAGQSRELPDNVRPPSGNAAVGAGRPA